MDIRTLMRNNAHNPILVFVCIIASALSASLFGGFYRTIFPQGFDTALVGPTGFWEPILGFPLALIFFLAILFSAIGKDKWKKWLYWSLVLPFLFELIFDLSHIYIPITLALIGYGIGLGVRKLLRR